MTGATYFVGEFVVASVPGGHGLAGSADVYGFPIPFVTFFPCCGGGGGPGYSVSLDNTSFYHPLNFVEDLALWLTISIAIASVFTIRRFALAVAAGTVLTLATLLLGPLSIVAPTPGMETGVLRPMGFPYEYLTYYAGGLLGFYSSGYDFTLSAAIADYALWTGVAFAIIGTTLAWIRGMRSNPTNPNLMGLNNPDCPAGRVLPDGSRHGRVSSDSGTFSLKRFTKYKCIIRLST
jgi:hypothetical protein